MKTLESTQLFRIYGYNYNDKLLFDLQHLIITS